MHLKIRIDPKTGNTRVISPTTIPPGEHTATFEVVADPPTYPYHVRVVGGWYGTGRDRECAYADLKTAFAWAADMIRENAESVVITCKGRTVLDFKAVLGDHPAF